LRKCKTIYPSEGIVIFEVEEAKPELTIIDVVETKAY